MESIISTHTALIVRKRKFTDRQVDTADMYSVKRIVEKCSLLDAANAAKAFAAYTVACFDALAVPIESVPMLL